VTYAEKVAAVVKGRELKTLLIDIERLPGLAYAWGPKTRYIPPDNFVSWPRTICFAALWYGTKRPVFYSEWQHGADDMHQAAFDLYDQADLVVTYNGVGFDNRHFMSGWTERQMGRPAPWQDIDLFRVVKQSQGWEAKSLDQVCKRLGIPAKNDRYSIEVAKAAVDGDPAAQKRIQRYCTNDTTIMVPVYEHILPHVKSHRHVAPSVGLERPTCPRCSSTDVTRTGNYSPGVYNYVAYKCNTCSGPFRTTYESRGPSVRAL
jgi:hypothetical protein